MLPPALCTECAYGTAASSEVNVDLVAEHLQACLHSELHDRRGWPGPSNGHAQGVWPHCTMILHVGLNVSGYGLVIAALSAAVTMILSPQRVGVRDMQGMSRTCGGKLQCIDLCM